jgi:hypothetical protein
MTIPKKGSRRIVVDDLPYRWAVRRKPTYAQALTEVGLTFAVVNETHPGTTLVIVLDDPRPDNWLDKQGASVLPSTVEQAIRKALLQGWRSADEGSPYVLHMQVAELSKRDECSVGKA